MFLLTAKYLMMEMGAQQSSLEMVEKDRMVSTEVRICLLVAGNGR